MLHIPKTIHDDAFVGTVRRTIRSACFKQLNGDDREHALSLCRRIKGGCLVRKAPPGATYLLHAHTDNVIIPVDDNNQLIRI